MQSNVMMAVEVRRRPVHARDESVDLRLDFALDVLRLCSRSGPARVADEPTARVHERRSARDRLAERQIDVDPRAEAGVAKLSKKLVVELAVDEHGRARDDAVAVRRQDAGT